LLVLLQQILRVGLKFKGNLSGSFISGDRQKNRFFKLYWKIKPVTWLRFIRFN